MKKILLIFLICLTSRWLPGQTTKQIGTDDGARELPFGMYYGFERSAAIYTRTEIGTFGFIVSLGWKVQAANQETCPIKIYLKTTSSTTLTATTWDIMKGGALLVYDATTSFPATGWRTIDITDFLYSVDNLLVLCETNYGTVPPSTFPWFWYDDMTGITDNRHEFWRNNDPSLLGNGAPDKLRPNIRITYLPVSGHNPPSGFAATAVSTAQVDLSWTLNSAGDNVMVAFNTSNVFGTPVTGTTYVPGNIISGGGTVIYNGAGTTWSQTTGLSPATTYYYKAWSVYSSPPTSPSYSSGTLASATTFCETCSTFPYITDFELAVFPPSCWSQASKTWIRSLSASGYGIGTASAKANFFSVFPGNFDLISPVLDISSLTDPIVKFDHAYATGSNEVDKLELWLSTDNGLTYTLLNTWLGGISGPLNTGGAISTDFSPDQNQWATKSFALPAGTNKIKFRGVSAHGNNLYIDNITISGTPLSVVWNGSISTSWNNPLNWSPSGIPNELQTVSIPEGTLHNPTVNAAGLTCKDLTLSSGAILTVNSSSSITVKGNMIIRDGASLDNMGSVTVNGNINIEN